jgi:hypothetical protein
MHSVHCQGIASGAQKHLVERLELSPDGTKLNYSFENGAGAAASTDTHSRYLAAR